MGSDVEGDSAGYTGIVRDGGWGRGDRGKENINRNVEKVAMSRVLLSLEPLFFFFFSFPFWSQRGATLCSVCAKFFARLRRHRPRNVCWYVRGKGVR